MEDKQRIEKEIKTIRAVNKMLGEESLCLALGNDKIKCPEGLCSECPYYNGKDKSRW
jgi:hypothetical protein